MTSREEASRLRTALFQESLKTNIVSQHVDR